MQQAKPLVQSPMGPQRTVSGLRTKAVALAPAFVSDECDVQHAQRLARGLAFGMVMTPVGAAVWYGLFELARFVATVM